MILEVAEKPAPAGIYSVPKAYTKGKLDVDLGLKEKFPSENKSLVSSRPYNFLPECLLF